MTKPIETKRGPGGRSVVLPRKVNIPNEGKGPIVVNSPVIHPTTDQIAKSVAWKLHERHWLIEGVTEHEIDTQITSIIKSAIEEAEGKAYWEGYESGQRERKK